MNIEISNPSLKYELLEYLVKENEEAEANSSGRDRGGRGHAIRDSDKVFNEVSMVILAKRGKAAEMPAESYSNDSARLRN